MAAVTWGYNSRSSIEILRPDYMIESPAQALQLMKDLAYPL